MKVKSTLFVILILIGLFSLIFIVGEMIDYFELDQGKFQVIKGGVEIGK